MCVGPIVSLTLDLCWAYHQPDIWPVLGPSLAWQEICVEPITGLTLDLCWGLQHYSCFFSCDQAALWMVFSVRLSVRLSVCPSVRLSHLFDYVPIIVSSWNFQELSHWTRVRSMQKVKVRGQRSRSQRSRPKFSFPDCNSSLNSHMMMKWYI